MTNDTRTDSVTSSVSAELDQEQRCRLQQIAVDFANLLQTDPSTRILEATYHILCVFIDRGMSIEEALDTVKTALDMTRERVIAESRKH